MSFDPQVLTDQARLRLPLKVLLQQHGLGPRDTGEKWSSFSCPFCHQKAASVFRGDGGYDLFKCFYTGGKRGGPCPSDNKVMDEPAVLALLSNLSRSDAWKTWLKEAGVWREREPLAPSVLPGQKARKKKISNFPESLPTQNPANQPNPQTEPQNTKVQKDEAGLQTDAHAHADASSGPPPPPSSPEIIPPTTSAISGEAPFTAADAQGEEDPDPVGAPSAPTGNGRHENNGDDLEENEEQKPSEALLALREFFAATSLSAEDKQKLLDQRGLVEGTCEGLGFKSSARTNREILVSLSAKYSMKALFEFGLYLQSDKGDHPNPKFFGWGEKGKKRLPTGEKAPEMDWVYPVLIPYFNRHGELEHLRPHRDMSKGVSPRLYVVRRVGESTQENHKTVVVTEGEFKAAALKQVLPHLGIVGIPGISMCRDDSPGTFGLVQELFAFLRRAGARSVIVAFDNEDKADPRLPGFKEDPRKRYDTQVWARYLAILVGQRGYEGRVAWLPKEWRDEKGKADWDSALAMLRQHGLSETAIRREFQGVLDSAAEPNDYRQPELFDLDGENTIKLGLEKKFRKPNLDCGSSREIKVAKKLLKCLHSFAQPDSQTRHTIEELAAAYRNTLGGYYIFKPLIHEKTERAYWRSLLDQARTKAQWDQAYAAERILRGRPHRFSDFIMEPMYSIQLVSSPTIERIVKLRNVSGEVKRRAKLDADSFGQPSKFRTWLLNMGNFTWAEGERELNKLQEDIGRELAYRLVYQVAHFGWHDESKLWFFHDCAVTPVGNFLLPDEDGIIWWTGLGYQLSETDREGEEFAQGRPRMRPQFGLVEDGWKFRLVEGAVDDPAVLKSLFQEMAQRLKETVGGYEAYLGLGSVLAFAVAPEFYGRCKWFPGLWCHGERGSGKTTFAGFMQRLWGFITDCGTNLNTSTKVGLLIAAQQYCWLPLWFEEYRSDIDPQKVAVVRGLYNRDLGLKKEFSDARRKILSNAVITGEATSHDSATRQRFVHLQLAESKRQANHLEWFFDHQDLFFTLGRHVLRHRTRFSESFQRAFRTWCDSQEMKDAGERSKLVYGVAYAGFAAAVELFESHPQTEVEAFRKFVVTQTVKAGVDVKLELNVNVFWQQLIDAHKLEAFGTSGQDIRRFFKVTKRRLPHPPGAPRQGAWDSYLLYFDYNGVIEVLRQHLAKQRSNLALNRQDLRDQLSKHPYWVDPPPGRSHVQRFSGSESPTRCWCINVDLHPMGYTPVSDEEFEESKQALSVEEWADPRKGDLFLVIHAAEKQQSGF